MIFVDGHRGGAGVDEELHRLTVDRAGDPVVAALPLGNAQLLAFGLGITRAQLATQGIVTLCTFDAQHRALAIGADHLNTTRPGLPYPHQLALTIDIHNGGARKQAYHLYARRGANSKGNQRQRGRQQGNETHW
ncbi:glutamate synthase-related protein [Stutzerimonas stutzeri]